MEESLAISNNYTGILRSSDLQIPLEPARMKPFSYFDDKPPSDSILNSDPILNSDSILNSNSLLNSNSILNNNSILNSDSLINTNSILKADSLLSSEIDLKVEQVEILSTSDDCSKPPSNSSSEMATERLEKRKQSMEEDELGGKKPRTTSMYATDMDNEEYSLSIRDVPKYFPVNAYARACGAVKAFTRINSDGQDIRLVFRSNVDRELVLNKIRDQGFMGRKFDIMIPGRDTEVPDVTYDHPVLIPHSSLLTYHDSWDSDPLYGLKLEFLRSLDITPPLEKWVHVTNFRCDKSELKEVLELAGHVVSCSVIMSMKKYAKVQYSHPLEAVQAIAMLNNQTYLGLPLSITMESNPKNYYFLPKGLKGIGVGLGLHGRPVRNIVHEYKKYTRHQHSLVNPILFCKNGFDVENNSHENRADFIRFLASMETTSNERMFEIKHVSPFDEDNDNIKNGRSPEAISVKSLDSSASSEEKKDNEKTCGSNSPNYPTQPPVPGNSNNTQESPTPILSRTIPENPGTLRNPSVSQTPGVPLNARMPQTNFRPGPPAPQVQYPNRPQVAPFVSGPGNPGPIRMPNPNYPMPNEIQNHTPNQMPNVMTNQVSNPMSNHAPNSMPNSMLNQMPTSIPNQMPNPMPNPIPNQMPNQIPNQMPGRMPIPVTNQMPNQTPSLMPKHLPNPIRNQPRPGPFVPPPFRSQSSTSYPVHGPIPVARPIALIGNRTVQFKNLPPSTTFPLLCEKVSSCGQLVSLQFTTPGCADVTFSHIQYAENCIQNFNGMNVAGHIITVEFARAQ